MASDDVASGTDAVANGTRSVADGIAPVANPLASVLVQPADARNPLIKRRTDLPQSTMPFARVRVKTRVSFNGDFP